MNMFYQEPYAQIIKGDCRVVLAELPIECAQMCVTSPPYWGKRKYEGEQGLIWGGEDDCRHQWGDEKIDLQYSGGTHGKTGHESSDRLHFVSLSNSCLICGAWKGAYGCEPTPEMYVKHTIEILRLIRRVLRKDGVVFWNIGDTYFGSTGGEHDYREDMHLQQDIYDFKKPQAIGKHPILKPKDMCLIPFRVAIAAQEDGWWVRRDIVWNKLNPKPESVTDRPTTSHDYILMLTKSDNYYWDREAVREPNIGMPSRGKVYDYKDDKDRTGGMAFFRNTPNYQNPAGRNLRSVWEFTTQPFPGAHFAVFPDDLPEICIKAATPEVGCCARCGAPWERILSPATGGAIGKSWHDHIDDEYKGDHKTVSSKGYKSGETIGWQPTCKCNADKVPSLVIDPFAGTGTTGKMAKILGRRSVLIDTSEKYCKMSMDKIIAVTLPMVFPTVEETYPGAPDWF